MWNRGRDDDRCGHVAVGDRVNAIDGSRSMEPRTGNSTPVDRPGGGKTRRHQGGATNPRMGKDDERRATSQMKRQLLQPCRASVGRHREPLALAQEQQVDGTLVADSSSTSAAVGAGQRRDAWTTNSAVPEGVTVTRVSQVEACGLSEGQRARGRRPATPMHRMGAVVRCFARPSPDHLCARQHPAADREPRADDAHDDDEHAGLRSRR